MLFQNVHTAGSAIYFVFFVLLLLSSRVPRTNSGCGWWASAIFLAFLARVSFLWIYSDDADMAKLLYSLLTLSEKLMLMIGVARFFGQWIRSSHLFGLVLVMQLWVLSAYAFQYPSWVYSTGLSLANGLCLLIVIITVHRGAAPIYPYIKTLIILFCTLLSLHWLLFVPVSRFFYEDWKVVAFILGTGLVVLLYTALIGAVFSMFQKRLMESESQALDMAYKDPLTGLSNRRYVDSLFGKALELAIRPHQLLAVCYIDLDNFKPVNDKAGHKTGDLILKEVAMRLRACIRSTDICARIGGDEFVVIATQLDQDSQIDGIARKILDRLNAPYCINKAQYSVGASIGISLYPSHGNEFTDLLEKADSAMYQMKKSGRGGFRLFKP